MRTGIAALTVFLAVVILPGRARSADLRYFEDAPLRAVQFIDDQVGWAVGDEGVIWSTIDGGRTWERLATGVRASLRSVHFLNPFFGWVAGREERPQGGSVGVLLFTKNGGQTWERMLHNALPGLNQVKFVDAKVGFLFGDGGEGFGSGVFATIDGGKNWEPLKGPRVASWLAGEFQDGLNGVFAGAWTQLATLREGQIRVTDNDELKDLGGRCLRGIHFLPKRIVAVGEGGLVLSSVSGGARYGFADLKLSPEVLANLDCHAIHGVGPKAWIVGRPGSFVLHTDDAGATWRLMKTGQNLPLNGVFFHDENRGWAVGELGAILATTNGGKTWSIQRQGGKRAALLTVNARLADLPLDTLAHLGGQEGYLAVALGLTRAEAGTSSLVHARDPFRVNAAARQSGGAVGEMLWQFPLPQHLAMADKQALLSHWNRLHNNQADLELLRQLVLALRVWRPEVVIGDWEKSNPAAALLGEALREAVRQAADPKAFPEQLETLGLAPWAVGKFYGLCGKSDAHVVFDNLEVKTRLEDTPRDFAARPAALLTELTPPGQRHFRLLASRTEGAEKSPRLMDGAACAEGDNRRKLPDDQPDLPVLMETLRNRRNLLALAEQWNDTNKAFSQISPALAKLPDEHAATAAHALAGMYVRRGQWHLAREAYLLMVDHFPSHPLSVDAYRWLIRHNSSSEARRRQEKGQFLLVSDVGYSNPAKPEPKQPLQQVQGMEKLVYLSNQTETRQWNKGSLEIGKRLVGFGPLYAADPSMQMCLQAARRHLGEFKLAQDWNLKLVNHLPKGPWQEAAAAEMWLNNRAAAPPKRTTICKLTAQKPFLDGDLDDACWKGLEPARLTNAVAATAKDFATEAMFSYDQQYLYIALRCKHPQGHQVPLAKNRPRDADLDGFDRVSILLDLDRDYSTYFRLEVDQRGLVREDCWGDTTWNPKWYVAVKSFPEGWTAEIAIPMDELTSDRVTINTTWAANVVRILPGRGVQAWSLPADVHPRPEGLGLLMFQQDQPPRKDGPMPRVP